MKKPLLQQVVPNRFQHIIDAKAGARPAAKAPPGAAKAPKKTRHTTAPSASRFSHLSAAAVLPEASPEAVASVVGSARPIPKEAKVKAEQMLRAAGRLPSAGAPAPAPSGDSPSAATMAKAKRMLRAAGRL